MTEVSITIRENRLEIKNIAFCVKDKTVSFRITEAFRDAFLKICSYAVDNLEVQEEMLPSLLLEKYLNSKEKDIIYVTVRNMEFYAMCNKIIFVTKSDKEKGMLKRMFNEAKKYILGK